MDQLSAGEREQGIRLSCMTEVLGDIEVELLKKERKHKVLTKGYVPEFVMDAYEDGYGIAIDIGTTTVVTSLIELSHRRGTGGCVHDQCPEALWPGRAHQDHV